MLAAHTCANSVVRCFLLSMLTALTIQVDIIYNTEGGNRIESVENNKLATL